MGSLVLNNFQPAMFGAGAHQHSHESATQTQHKPSSGSRSSHQDADHVDTPMTDAPMHHSSASAASIRRTNNDDTTPVADEQPKLQQPSSSSFRPEKTQDTPTAHVPNAPPLGRSGKQPPSGASSVTSSPISLMRSPADSASASPRRIKVKSLLHIQSFATDEKSTYSQTRSMSRRTRRDPNNAGPQYEISEMPVTDIIEMVAGLLTKITTTNDRQHEHLHRQIPPPDASGLSLETTSVLAFHGKNVPSISILSYLSRIHKYCPTTYEVFLSLLVYFDRMTERVNAGPMHRSSHLHQPNERSNVPHTSSRHSSVSSAPLTGSREPSQQALSSQSSAATPPPSGSLGKSSDSGSQRENSSGQPPSPPQSIEHPLNSDPYNLSHFFVVDSYNIHRLVIAGVTCASKFFSDVFYTNSRYAKVGGLPLAELNHLELQFLLLNDFRLAVPLEEMEAYGTMLVEFYAREVVAQQQQGGRGGHGGGHQVAVTT